MATPGGALFRLYLAVLGVVIMTTPGGVLVSTGEACLRQVTLL